MLYRGEISLEYFSILKSYYNIVKVYQDNFIQMKNIVTFWSAIME